MIRIYLGIVATACLIAGCASAPNPTHSAQAQLAPLGGHPSRGKVTFSSPPHGASKISGQVSALAPNGWYALQIQAAEDCSPWSSPNALPTAHLPLPATAAWPDVRANAYGMAVVQWDVAPLPLGPGRDSLIGQVLLVASVESDRSGQRPVYWACGVIEPM